MYINIPGREKTHHRRSSSWSELKIEFPRTFHFIKPSSSRVPLHFSFSSFPISSPPPRFLLSLSTSSKAHYLHGSLIDYKRSILFPRNMAVKRGRNIPFASRPSTMNTEKEVKEAVGKLLSLPFHPTDGKPFFLVSAFPLLPSFLPSFLHPLLSPSFNDSFSLPLVCSSHILLDLASSLVIPAESSPVPSKVPVCRVSLFLPYYEYSPFSFFFLSLSLSFSLFFSPPSSRPLARGRRDPRRRVSSSSLVLRPALFPRLFSMAVV